MKKLLTYTAVLATAISVIGCGGGGSSSSAPANTTTTYNITNKTGYDLQTVSVIDGKTGTETQAGNLNCAAQASDCLYYYTGPKINGPDTLVFKNSSGNMVAAYVSGYDQAINKSIVVSDWSTGLYLHEKLERQNENISKLSQGDFEARMHSFTLNYDSPDGAADYYEETAHYYAYETKVNKLSESAFIDRFGDRLLKEEAADRSEFYNIQIASSILGSVKLAFNDLLFGKYQVISPVYAQAADTGGGCSSGLSTFMDFVGIVVGGVQNAFPLAGTVASVGKKAADLACGSSPSLTEIMNKLNEIQTSLSKLHDRLGELTTLVANGDIQDVQARFRKVATEAVDRGNNYKTVVKNQTKSLLQYVNESPQGNLGAHIDKYPNGVVNQLMQAVLQGKTGNLVTDINALTDEKFGKMLTAIVAICAKPTEGDVISKRVQCNLAINTSISRLLASQEVALKIAYDVYQTAEANPDVALAAYGYDSTKTAEEHYSDLKNTFLNQQTLMKNKLESSIKNANNTNQNGYYNAFDGLDKQLLTNMKAAACWDDEANAAPISKWVKANEEKTVWIETACRVGSTSGAPVLARYFLKLDNVVVGNSDVANVMGVLVEKRYVTGPDKWYVGSRYSTGIEMISPFIASKRSGAAPVPGFVAYNNQPRIKHSNIVDVVDNSPDANSIIWERDGATDWPNEFSTWRVSGTGDYQTTWTRVTDAIGYSYVFNVATSVAASRDNRWFYIYCVTGDCVVDNVYSGTVDFTNGPKDVSVSQGQGAASSAPYGWTNDGQFM